MDNKPTVSIIIPLYNKESYVQRALDSVEYQTFKDYEVIVINDGSTDNGPEIVKRHKNLPVRMYNQSNKGPGAARNKGVKESRGKYIAFLDADDEWLPTFLEDSYYLLEKHTICDICVSAWYQEFVSSENPEHGNSIIDIYKRREIELYPGIITPDIAIREKRNLYLWFTSTVFLRRDVFRNGYRFYGSTRHTYGEDFYLWLQLAFNHTFYRNCTPLAWYHNNASDLAKGSYYNNPLEAFLLCPDKIVANSRLENKRKIRCWIANYAIRSAHARLGVGQFANAVILIKKHPSMIITSTAAFLFLILKIILYKTGIYKPEKDRSKNLLRREFTD